MIDNFAIIDHLELEFFAGMTVLTGETGAGKSILIDAISLLAGDRASQEMIRAGSEKAAVKGIFFVSKDKIRTLMRELGIPAGETIIVEREITIASKNTVKINDIPTTLADLKTMMRQLLDIHSQFDTQKLLSPATYLELLDNYQPDLTDSYRHTFQTRLADLRASENQRREQERKQRELAEKRDIYQYQLDELTQLAFAPDELERLHQEAKTLDNFDKVHDTLQAMLATIRDSSLAADLHGLLANLGRLAAYSPEFVALQERFANHYYELDDLFHEITRRADNLNFDPEHLNRINERIYQLTKTSEKYRLPLPELYEHQVALSGLLAEADSIAFSLDKLNHKVEEAFQNTLFEARKLTQARTSIADRISEELDSLFAELGLPAAKLKISITTRMPASPKDSGVFSETGVDEIDFLLTTNIGEPFKPLAKTASGGEMSRIMLAFKTLFVRSQQLSTIIFDEIDTGISGKIANQIAGKIKAIAHTTQVLSITHIPQVVACGDHHLRVMKHEHQARTTAAARYLDFEERILDIASMIATAEPTPASIQSARELLLGLS